MVAFLTETLSKRPYIPLTTFSVSSHLMSSPSLYAKPLDREHCHQMDHVNQTNRYICSCLTSKSCRCLASPNSTWWISAWSYDVFQLVMSYGIMNCVTRLCAVQPLLPHTFSHASASCKTTTTYQRPYLNLHNHYVCPQSRQLSLTPLHSVILFQQTCAFPGHRGEQTWHSEYDLSLKNIK